MNNEITTEREVYDAYNSLIKIGATGLANEVKKMYPKLWDDALQDAIIAEARGLVKVFYLSKMEREGYPLVNIKIKNLSDLLEFYDA